MQSEEELLAQVQRAGIGPPDPNIRRCRRGHPMTERNTQYGKCRLCRNAARYRYEKTEKGRTRRRRYTDSAKGMLSDVRDNASRRGAA